MKANFVGAETQWQIVCEWVQGEVDIGAAPPSCWRDEYITSVVGVCSAWPPLGSLHFASPSELPA